MKKNDTSRKKKTDPFYSSPAWRKVRGEVYRRAGGRCENCGASVTAKGAYRIHHKMPRRKFPELALYPPNLICLCVGCDNAVHTHDRALHGRRGTPTAIGPDGFPVGSDWSGD